MTPAATPRFENINLLRAFAAFAVLTYHVIEHGKWTSFPMEGPLITFRIGWIGMDLFFAISGFVICYSALILYRERPREFTRVYWLRRTSRIVPLYLLTMVAWIVVAWPGFFREPPIIWGAQIATHLTFTHTFFPQTAGAIDGPNWSLGVEMQFYLLIALLIRWIDRTPGWRIWLYATLVSWAWRAAVFMVHKDSGVPTLALYVYQMPGFLDEFGAGIFLAKWVLGDGPRTMPGALTWLVAACASVSAAMALYWPWAGFWQHPYMVAFWHTAFAVALLCVLGFCVAAVQFATWKVFRPLDYLGDISYGIYLWHLVVIHYVLKVAGIGVPDVLFWVIAGSIVLAALSWRYFEQPFMNLARDRARKAPAPASG